MMNNIVTCPACVGSNDCCVYCGGTGIVTRNEAAAIHRETERTAEEVLQAYEYERYIIERGHQRLQEGGFVQK